MNTVPYDKVMSLLRKSVFGKGNPQRPVHGYTTSPLYALLEQVPSPAQDLVSPVSRISSS
jgi:hypothetical protein